MNKKLKNCSTCGKEIAKSVKVCPHCGAKQKMGIFGNIVFLIIIAVIGIAVVGSPSSEEKEQMLRDELSSIASGPTNSVDTKQIIDTFAIMGNGTDIQRNNLEEQLKGKIVRWPVKVYEVAKKDENVYRIQTTDSNTPAAFIDLYARSESESRRIEQLSTGDVVIIKGRIVGTFMRNIEIEKAIIAD